jgi:mannose-6-phosphate isomerase-like protein (cupin superfamily)
MASEGDDVLREMARHRGLRLVKSRRRKVGGDFGKFGLTGADGAQLFGFGADGLTASADDIATYLRSAVRADWAGSTKGITRTLAAPPPSAPPPPPKPKFKPAVANLFARLPVASRAEAFTELVSAPRVRVERIVSSGQVTPADAPMVQDRDEWVIVLQGEAAMRVEDSDEITLAPGDHLTIAAGQKHWVTRTSDDPPTVWLAVHFDG